MNRWPETEEGGGASSVAYAPRGVIKGIIIIWYRWLYDNVLFRVWTKARFRFPRLWMILGGFAWGYKSKIPVSRLPFMTKRHFCSAVKVPFRIYSKNNTDNPLFSLNLGSFESVLLASSFSEQRIEVVHFRAQLKLELLNLRAGFNSNFSTNIPHSFPTKSPPPPGKISCVPLLCKSTTDMENCL